jgi:LysM repeat protein
VRITALLPGLALCLWASQPVRAQNPGAQQDAEAAREKLLKASDALDNIQANSENTRVAVDGVKTDVASLQKTVTQLQSDNAALKQQLADLQAAFDQEKADQVKERQALIDNVADMLAKGGGKSAKKKSADTDAEPTAPIKSTEVHADLQPTAPSLTPPPDASSSADPSPAPPKPKGYHYTVAGGETVAMIAEAYRDKGVKVTAAQIRKANGLTPDSVLKPGQKLFIPKPGT